MQSPLVTNLLDRSTAAMGMAFVAVEKWKHIIDCLKGVNDTLQTRTLVCTD